MERTPTPESSNVASVGFDPATDVLEVEFKKGSIYQYRNVTHQMWADLLRSPSKGGWVRQQLVKNPAQFPCTRIQ